MGKNFTVINKEAFLRGYLLIALQNVRLTGRITEPDGTTIPGVNVVIKGASVGTSSDANGAYALDVQEPNAIIVFSFIGFASQEVPLNGRSVSDVKTLKKIISITS